MKKMTYIEPKEALRKLQYARTFSETVYIGGATGFGKTELVRYYLKSRHYVYISCEEECPMELLPQQIEEVRKKSTAMDISVVVDDIQHVESKKFRDILLDLSEEKGIWLILIGRSALPDWLAPIQFSDGLIVVGENNLALSPEDTETFFKDASIPVDHETAKKIAEFTDGNPMNMKMLAEKVVGDGASLNGDLKQKVKEAFSYYLNFSVFPKLDQDVVGFCTQISVVDKFNKELAEYITGGHRVDEMLAKVLNWTSALSRDEQGWYHFRHSAEIAFRMRRDRVYDSVAIHELYYNAGLYYEIHGMLPEALDMYEKCGSDRGRNLLIQNSKKNPGNGFFFQMRKYYLALSDEEVASSIYLMAGESMFYSLLMNQEMSEKWYAHLKDYSAKAVGWEKKEAQRQLLILDIALPHRGVKDIAKLFRKAPILLFSRGIELPELCVTSNLPSMMNGGLDFADWSRHDKALAFSLGKIVEKALGRYGRGLVSLALAESFYEKGEDLMEVLTLISRGQMEAQNGGKLEMEFVATGLLIKLNLYSGRFEDAKSQLDIFRRKAVTSKADKLLPNIDAMECRMALCHGDLAEVDRWMETQAPDETEDFFVMDRYRYLTKVRCYILEGDYMKAAALLEKIMVYAKGAKRPMNAMEAGILMSIILYRRGDPGWREEFEKAMNLVTYYHFSRMVSREGAAVLPLLREYVGKGSCRDDSDRQQNIEDFSSEPVDPEEGQTDEKPGRAEKDSSADPTDDQILHEIDLEYQKKNPEEKESKKDAWLDRCLQETNRVAGRYPRYLRNEVIQISDFSDKALNVLRLQAKGFSLTDIAQQLDMKPETVRYHIKQNYRKLQASSKSEAVLAAREFGLL